MRWDRWFLVFGLCFFGFGCGEDSAPTGISRDPQVTPEGVVQELQVSYRTRDSERYAKLLAPEFKFVFQLSDPSAPPEGFWTRDEDSTGTEALFRTPEVTAIRIDLLHGPSEAPEELGFSEDVKRILVNQTLLEVDEQSGITWQVTDLQAFFFRPGREENGEDPGLWYLLEWRDLPVSSSPGVGGAASEQAVTWGSLKTKYISVDPPPPAIYKPQTSPENVVYNLQASYRRREIAEYEKLLAPEFTFVFQPSDSSRPPEGFWTRDQDSTGTDALFRTPLVVDIRVDLLHGPPQTPTEPGFEADVKRILVNQTLLEVDEQNGITWRVTDLQDMFFRPGREASGEDPSLWYLLEWRDLPSVAAGLFVAVAPTTWGSLKAQYR